MAEGSPDRLWAEYSSVFEGFDDTTLARWLAQTLGQLGGRVWRFSHPLIGAYRLAAEVGHRRQHCSETLAPFEDLPADVQTAVKSWADAYAPVHAVAHWEDRKRKTVADYEQACDDAADEAEKLLAIAGRTLLPRFLDLYPAVIWEDSDECLEVRPEDVAV